MRWERVDIPEHLLAMEENADLFPEPGEQPPRRSHQGVAEDTFAYLFAQVSDAELVPEYEFHTVRRWRFDFAHVETRIAVEIDGGVWTAGRHTRGGGFVEDCRKLNEAAALGWRVFRFPAHQLSMDDALLVARAIEIKHSRWTTPTN